MSDALSDFGYHLQSIFGLHLHSPGDYVFVPNVWLGLLFIFSLVDCVRSREFTKWMASAPELSHVVTGSVIRTRGWNLRRDFRVTFKTMSGLTVTADAGYGVPLYSTLGLNKGAPVSITYCETNPNLFYITSVKSEAVREARRKTILGPVWMIAIALGLFYLNFMI